VDHQFLFRRIGADSRLATGKGVESMTDYLIPLILFGSAAWALGKRENAYDLMLTGGLEGLKLVLSILPALVFLLSAVHMLRASGAMELLVQFLSPFFSFFGIPPETAMLVLIRPISGSAALAVGAELMSEYGVDSQIGRTVAVMLGSTETTFYTISVYFGAAGIQKTRYTLPAALFADLVGFVVASLTARWLF
jgi:spore maturation protein B